jgi:hypothetical protein
LALTVAASGLKVRPDHLAKIGQVGEFVFATKELTTELALKLLDCAREGGLRHVTLLGGTREVQVLCDCKKITDLVHSKKRNRPVDFDPSPVRCIVEEEATAFGPRIQVSTFSMGDPP